MDLPAIEYHPFGTITLNFDDRPIKLRRCRVGDLQYAKDLVEEVQDTALPRELTLITELNAVRAKVAKTEKTVKERRLQIRALSTQIADLRRDVVFDFINPIALRMGDAQPPPKEDWPVELLDAAVVADVLEHWQTRPLASGRLLPPLTTTQNGQSSSAPQPQEVDFPAAPPPL